MGILNSKFSQSILSNEDLIQEKITDDKENKAVKKNIKICRTRSDTSKMMEKNEYLKNELNQYFAVEVSTIINISRVTSEKPKRHVYIDDHYRHKIALGSYEIPGLPLEFVKKIDSDCLALSKILVLYTGGTIGMKKNDGVYEPEINFLPNYINKLPMFNDKSFKNKYIESLQSIHNKSFANEFKNVFTMPLSAEGKRVIYEIIEYVPLLDSSDMTMDDYVRIAHDINKYYNNFDGFIILHGTDTMSYTGSALSFILENLSKPVILTGSQIPLYELRSDGRDNFLTSLIIASHYNLCEVVLVFHQHMLRANRSVKNSSFHFDAFESPNYPPLADFDIDIKVHHDRLLLPGEGKFCVHDNLCPDVAVLRMFPSITCNTVSAFLNPTVKGVVLMSFGSGNMPFCRKDLLQLFKKANDRGCLIVNISQCQRGGVKAIYRTGFILKEYGIFPGVDMTVEGALSKLSYVIGKDDWSLTKKRQMMMTNLRGELTPAP